MTSSKTSEPDLLSAGVAVLVGCVGTLWLGGALSALLTTHRLPRERPVAGVLALSTPKHPGRAWHAAVGPTWQYWLVTAAVVSLVAGMVLMVRHVASRARSVSGFASQNDLRRAAGGRAVLRRAAVVRPGLVSAHVEDVALKLGRVGRDRCWTSIEDSVVILGPPRSGKGLHLVVAAIVDSPGAVLTTSTRPDNLAATLRSRQVRGPVAIFDPQRLAEGVPQVLRWSPVRGCEDPAVAMTRARTLTAGGGHDVDNASFWTQQATIAVRCLLHAAGLQGLQAIDVVRWSLSPLSADEAVDILRAHPAAAPAWCTALEAILTADPRQRDSTWSMVSNAFACLADPKVLDAVTPVAGEHFDPQQFLLERGTLYLLGTASGAGATASLVSALVEDVVETARRLAARSAGARLEPPLSVILDEAANYPLPSLLPLMSEGGGSGICTWVVLQSLAQARARWGPHEAAAVWDTAVAKMILGGSSNAEDLRDLSALLGNRTVSRINRSRGPDGKMSVSVADDEVPVLTSGELRTLPFGRGLLLLRSCAPVQVSLEPWNKRHDADEVHCSKAEVERQLAGPERRDAE